jgi:transcriptional regulator with XRE-family HTH domain
MGRINRARRAGAQARVGRVRARQIALRLGVGLREARIGAGMTQAQVGDRAALSQTLISDLETGHGQGASIETWAMVAAAVGEQLAAFLERAPGASLPRDIEHVRRQNAVIKIATPGGWAPMPEFRLDQDARWSRSIDVALVRRATAEAVVVEIWNWFDDVGGALRGLDGKVAALRDHLDPSVEWTVRGLFVVRDTRRNRQLVTELGPVFGARFPGNARTWLRALTDPAQRLPEGDGLLWSDRAGTSLRASRLPGLGPGPP